MSIHRHLQEQGFDSDQTERIGAAFDVAWQVVKSRQPDVAQGPFMTSVRETLAKFILDEAKKGETNTTRLADAALIRFLDLP